MIDVDGRFWSKGTWSEDKASCEDVLYPVGSFSEVRRGVEVRGQSVKDAIITQVSLGPFDFAFDGGLSGVVGAPLV